MSSRTTTAAAFLHEHGYTILSADASSGGGISSALGRWGSGGLCLILCVLIRGLTKTDKAQVKKIVNEHPSILISLGLLTAASFANAAGLWDDVVFMTQDLVLSVNDAGLGDSTPAAIGVAIFLILWLYGLKLWGRLICGFIAFVVWKAADGSLFENITNLFDHISHMLAG